MTLLSCEWPPHSAVSWDRGAPENACQQPEELTGQRRRQSEFFAVCGLCNNRVRSKHSVRKLNVTFTLPKSIRISRRTSSSICFIFRTPSSHSLTICVEHSDNFVNLKMAILTYLLRFNFGGSTLCVTGSFFGSVLPCEWPLLLSPDLKVGQSLVQSVSGYSETKGTQPEALVDL